VKIMKLKKLFREHHSDTFTAYAMLSPNILLMSVFIFAPIVYAFYVSLHDWNGLSGMKFIGIKNYINLFDDEEFWLSLWITVKYTLVFVPSVFCFALLLALLVNSIKGKAQEVYRTMYFLPYSISLVVGGLVWSFMYDPTKGFINQMLNMIGIENQNFLMSTDLALYSVAAVGLWLVIGFNMIIFLASLKDIPKTYYEAANIDGANSIRKFFHITFPLLKNTNAFIIIITTIGSFQVFDQLKVMTNGGPAFSSTVTVLYIYKQAFELSKLGFSSAAAFVLFVIIMVLTLIQIKATSSKEEE
jgi:multiple sugar transport system permease protein